MSQGLTSSNSSQSSRFAKSIPLFLIIAFVILIPYLFIEQPWGKSMFSHLQFAEVEQIVEATFVKGVTTLGYVETYLQNEGVKNCHSRVESQTLGTILLRCSTPASTPLQHSTGIAMFDWFNNGLFINWRYEFQFRFGSGDLNRLQDYDWGLYNSAD